MVLIDVLAGEPGHTLLPGGRRPEVFELHCAWPGGPSIPRPGATVTLHQVTLDQTAREALMQEVLDVTQERFGKGGGMGVSFDEEQLLLVWEWYGPQAEANAQVARDHLAEKGFSGAG